MNNPPRETQYTWHFILYQTTKLNLLSNARPLSTNIGGCFSITESVTQIHPVDSRQMLKYVRYFISPHFRHKHHLSRSCHLPAFPAFPFLLPKPAFGRKITLLNYNVQSIFASPMKKSITLYYTGNCLFRPTGKWMYSPPDSQDSNKVQGHQRNCIHRVPWTPTALPSPIETYQTSATIGVAHNSSK